MRRERTLSDESPTFHGVKSLIVIEQHAQKRLLREVMAHWDRALSFDHNNMVTARPYITGSRKALSWDLQSIRFPNPLLGS
jgi:hypothetical protein